MIPDKFFYLFFHNTIYNCLEIMYKVVLISTVFNLTIIKKHKETTYYYLVVITLQKSKTAFSLIISFYIFNTQ